MGHFICEKCGHIDETTRNNNYRHATSNRINIAEGLPIDVAYDSKFEYFETHRCCCNCCNGVRSLDGLGILGNGWFSDSRPIHWSEIGKAKLLELEALHDGSMLNASEYFADNGI